MPDSQLAVVSVDSFLAPALIARAGPTTRKKFFEFFTVPIRNANTRAAYYRAIQQTSEREKGVSRLRGREAPFWVYDLAAIDNLADPDEAKRLGKTGEKSTACGSLREYWNEILKHGFG